MWDFFDSGYNEEFDTLSLWYDAFWDSSTANGHKNFHQFMRTIYTLYPNYMDKIGDILTHHKLAVNIREEYSTVNNNKIIIDYTIPSCTYKIDSIVMIFYDDNGNIILTKAVDPKLTPYCKLTSSEYTTIITSCESTFSVVIKAYQTNAPLTGEYYSERVYFNIPN